MVTSDICSVPLAFVLLSCKLTQWSESYLANEKTGAKRD